MKLVRAGDTVPAEQPSRFTGEAELMRRLDEQRLAGIRVALVTFTGGGRTFWHLHHGEQVLYVISGKGWFQKANQERVDIFPGDLVYVAPRENHWHGAQAGDSMQHIAITIGATEWGEEVAD